MWNQARFFSGVPGKARFVQVKFVAHSDGLLHGFSGYFRAILYGDVEQSLVQGGSTDGLITWNNIFFPLVFPCRISRNDTICLQFWRRSDAQFVWYEWALVEPCLTLVHNIGGAIYRMPLAIANAEWVSAVPAVLICLRSFGFSGVFIVLQFPTASKTS